MSGCNTSVPHFSLKNDIIRGPLGAYQKVTVICILCQPWSHELRKRAVYHTGAFYPNESYMCGSEVLSRPFPIPLFVLAVVLSLTLNAQIMKSIFRTDSLVKFVLTF